MSEKNTFDGLDLLLNKKFIKIEKPYFNEHVLITEDGERFSLHLGEYDYDSPGLWIKRILVGNKQS